ncbi:MAG TPA: tetratricopeptide repeat protein [Pyrinomonadaceae bacterium]|jgi:Tfp pilus assembly protein PilF
MSRSLRSIRRALEVTAAVVILAAAPGGPPRAAHASSLLRQGKGSERAKALIAEGAAAMEKGDEAGARNLFLRAVEADPASELAHTYLGVLADRAGDLKEAERHFATAAIEAPTSAPARNNHGAILLRLGRPEQAAKQFEASLRIDPKQPSALVNLAQIRFASGTPENLRTASELFERAYRIEPEADIARALVVISLKLGDREAAARHFRAYAAAPREPGDARVAPSRAELGAALLEAGLAEEAARELTAAVEAEPANAEAVVLLGRAHLARRDIRAAGRTLEGAVARGVDSAAVYVALAEVYTMSGHPENAIPAMRLAVERDPSNEFYRFRYAMLLTDTRAPKAAVIRLQEALEKFPRSSRLWFALGVAQFTDRRVLEAAQAFRRAVEIEPGFAAALAYLGMTYAEQGQFTEAVPFYEKAIAADERLAPALYLMADAILKQATSDKALAEKYLARATAADATFLPAKLELAKLYANTGRLEEAARHLEQVVAANPELAQAQYQLGLVYRRLKRNAEAESALAKFKRLSDLEQQQVEAGRQDVVRRLANVRF